MKWNWILILISVANHFPQKKQMCSSNLSIQCVIVTTSKVWSELGLTKKKHKKKNLFGEFVFKPIWKEMTRVFNFLWNINVAYYPSSLYFLTANTPNKTLFSYLTVLSHTRDYLYENLMIPLDLILPVQNVSQTDILNLAEPGFPMENRYFFPRTVIREM